MTTAESPINSVIEELERLIEALKEGRIRCLSINRMTTVERVAVIHDDVVYQKVYNTDISFSGEVK
jgi:hypothetical protein